MGKNLGVTDFCQSSSSGPRDIKSGGRYSPSGSRPEPGLGSPSGEHAGASAADPVNDISSKTAGDLHDTQHVPPFTPHTLRHVGTPRAVAAMSGRGDNPIRSDSCAVRPPLGPGPPLGPEWRCCDNPTQRNAQRTTPPQSHQVDCAFATRVIDTRKIERTDE